MEEATEKTVPVDPSLKWLEDCLVGLDPIAPVQNAEQLRGLLGRVPSESRQLILVEVIKCDMAAAAEVGMRRGIDFYLSEFGDWLPEEQIPLDLVLEELQLRREAGEEPDLEEYRLRFPGLASTIGRFLAVGEATSQCAQRTPLPEFVLHQIVDDFQILGVLGQGAFARVYLARQESMHRLVALKASVHGSDEPQALSQLDHPNVVRVYDQRTCLSPALRLLYMQYVPGGTLAECIEYVRGIPVPHWSGQLIVDSVDRSLVSAGQIAPEGSPTRQALSTHDWPTAVAWIGVQLAEGLAYAHAHGVLHRDVKPANILLSTDGVPKLADFNVSFSGIAGRAGAAVNFGGSLAYMSPEQLRSADPTDPTAAEQLDNRSDLFSLGVVLWELYHGARPWKTEGAVLSWQAAVQAQLALRQAPLPNVPIENAVGRVLDRTLRRALSFSPDQRPKNGGELAGALRLALYPEVAERFDPPPRSLAQRLGSLPVHFLVVPLALLPNVAAAIFNYIYNASQFMLKYPEFWTQFERLSLIVNGVLFPIGVGLTLWRMQPVAAAVRKAAQAEPPDGLQVAATWNLGHAVAVISGSLWVFAGLLFPIVLFFINERFRWADAVQFFISLVVSGGVAITYPFFGLSLLSVLIYYPKLIRPIMSDPDFARIRDLILRRCRRYLALAAITPLLALALLVLQAESSRAVLLATIGTTALGLALSFWAYQTIDETARQLSAVLAPSHSLARARSE